MTSNLLAESTSPYLLQHKDNPVHWRPWGPEALAEAKASGKPILLSIGYAACHWCHVMAHESFEDPDTAALMNALFVNVKVDREERPDVDTVYQSALGLLGQQGGWPLTMFLTPDGEPYFGGTYWPPEERFGRPGFKRVLEDVAGVWRDQRDKALETTAAIRERLVQGWTSNGTRDIDPNALDTIARRATQRIDLFFGGNEGSPKFPNTPTLGLIWRAFMRSALAPFVGAVGTSLDNMCQGGLYDHVGGGFARYAVDERWLIPHFEKMLYDQAMLVEFMTLAWQHLRAPLLAARIDETVDFLLREMVTKEGGFAASLDADSEGEEGKFYVWSEAEIDEALGPVEAPFFKQVYGVSAQGNFEGQNVLHRLGAIGFLRPDQEATLTRNRRMLLMARSKRVRPSLDDKMLADWNGLAIAALAQAGAAFRRPEWHFAAVRAFWAVVEKMAEGQVLAHSYRDGRKSGETALDGYAYMCRAALILHEITADPRYLEKATIWVRRLDEKFWDGVNGGYYFASSDTSDLLVRPKGCYDGPTPNANGVMLEVLARLGALSGDTSYAQRIQATMRTFSDQLEANPLAAPTFWTGIEYVYATVQIVIVGEETRAETQALVRAVFERSLPNRLLTIVKPGTKLPSKHPASGKGLEGGKPAAYLCFGTECSSPVTNPQELAARLIPMAFHLVAQQQQALQQQGANGLN
jgi:uncharacterized protein